MACGSLKCFFGFMEVVLPKKGPFHWWKRSKKGLNLRTVLQVLAMSVPRTGFCSNITRFACLKNDVCFCSRPFLSVLLTDIGNCVLMLLLYMILHVLVDHVGKWFNWTKICFSWAGKKHLAHVYTLPYIAVGHDKFQHRSKSFFGSLTGEYKKGAIDFDQSPNHDMVVEEADM